MTADERSLEIARKDRLERLSAPSSTRGALERALSSGRRRTRSGNPAGCSTQSVPSLSNVAIRSPGGTNSGAPSSSSSIRRSRWRASCVPRSRMAAGRPSERRRYQSHRADQRGGDQVSLVDDCHHHVPPCGMAPDLLVLGGGISLTLHSFVKTLILPAVFQLLPGLAPSGMTWSGPLPTEPPQGRRDGSPREDPGRPASPPIAAVHAQELPGDEARPVRGDEQHRIRDLVGRGQPPERHLGDERLLVLGVLAGARDSRDVRQARARRR